MEGIEHEVNFWTNFVQTERFLNGWVGNHKTPELSDEVADFILSVPHESVLDVGSGVVSILNGLVEVTAADPLSDHYRKIFDYEKYKLRPPLKLGVEDLIMVDAFDIVHISNALDHSQDPVTGYYKLLDAVKPGGYLIVQGFENEGQYEKYQGMHQWNLSIDGDQFVIKDKKGEVERFAGAKMYKVIKFENGKDWFIWIVQK